MVVFSTTAILVIGLIVSIVTFLGGWHLGDEDWGLVEWDQEGGSSDEDRDDFPITLKVAGLGGLILFAALFFLSKRGGK